jgi:cathepsin L/cathepsin K
LKLDPDAALWGVLYSNPSTIKEYVSQQPLLAGIAASTPSFLSYTSGIYNDPDCGTTLTHTVLVVGYGVDYWIL